MNPTPLPGTTRSSAITRAIAAAGVIGVLATACGSDTGTSEPGSPATSADVTTTVADQALDGTAGAVTITDLIDFETESGLFDVPEGASVLGCENGSFVEAPLAAVMERVFTCESGERSGSFTVHFQPEMAEQGRFTSSWTVEDSTGDFAGLRGNGDFVGVLTDDEVHAEATWTGEITFGTPDDEPSADAETEAEADSTLDSFDGDLGAFLDDRVERLQVPADAGAVMVAVIDAEQNAVSAADGADPDGVVPTPADPFRVGSITKVFTSLTTLSLVDDGLVALDDSVGDLVTRVAVPSGVTVRDLLQHTSGIPNLTDVEDFFDSVGQDRTRRWTPEEAVDVVADREPDFEPGEEFAYSNTNYIVLGILIEELTGRPFHQVTRERVIEPAGLVTTYLAGAEDGPAPVAAYAEVGDRPPSPIDFDYTSLATAAWSAGAMVSSAEDLHRLFTALYDGEIITDEMRSEMTANEGYGLGIEPWEMQDSLVGHGGDIDGYHTLVFHAPESGLTAFWASTSDGLSFHPLVDDTVHAMVPELAEGEVD
jgi:D-alanyl-D-alanine carboxypeptidase